MAKCGSCKADGQTVAHVKACYAAKAAPVVTVTAEEFKPMALAKPVATPAVPESKYALTNEAGDVVFYEVKVGKKGTWKGFVFVEHLVGHPGDWMRYPVKGAARANVLAQIGHDPAAAAKMFSIKFTCCARCYSPLSDKISIAAGLGETCRSYFGM